MYIGITASVVRANNGMVLHLSEGYNILYVSTYQCAQVPTILYAYVPSCLCTYMLMRPHAYVPTRDGPNSEAKDSNSNPNHFILLESESESESTQVVRSLIRILVQRIRIRIRESTVNMHDMHDLKAQYRVPPYVLHIQTLIYLTVLALLIL